MQSKNGERFAIHLEYPQRRALLKAVESLNAGHIIIYPTETSYAFACQLKDKEALVKLQQLRVLQENHLFTLLCENLSQVGVFATLENDIFRIIKRITPGSYTFILKASPHIPKRLWDEKRKTVGFRIPSHPVALALLELYQQPLITTTLCLPNQKDVLTCPDEIFRYFGKKIAVFLDVGEGKSNLTTVIDFTTRPPQVLREGHGDIKFLSN